MSFSVLLAVLRNEPLLVALIVAFALLCAVGVWLYFYASRPKCGTLEWIKCFDTKHFKWFAVHSLRWQVLPWMLLTIVLTAVLHIVRMCCFLDVHKHPELFSRLLASAESILINGIAPAVAFAVAMFLLIYVMHGQAQTAMLVGTLGAFTLSTELWAVALVTVSMLFLYIWMTAKPDAPLFFHAFWLMLAGLCYGVALLECWATVFLLPMYIAAYCVTQVYRWREGDRDTRKGKLIGSIALLLTVFVLGTVLMWLLYYLPGVGKVRVWTLLSSAETYRAIFPTVMEKLRDLFASRDILTTVFAGDVFLFLLGLAACVPAVHAVIKDRQSLALTALCCLIPFLLMWLLCGMYMMTPVLLLLVAWVWKTYAQRGRTRYALCGFLAASACFFAELLLR